MKPQKPDVTKFMFMPLKLFRGVYLIFLIVCLLLIALSVKSDIERIKLDTAADFSSRVQQLETTVSQLEVLATILSQSLTYNFDFSMPLDVEQLFEQQTDGMLVLKQENDSYRSSLFTKPPTTNQELHRLALLLKTGASLPHFLIEEKIESIAVYTEQPRAKLIYPYDTETAHTEYQKELSSQYWQYFWDKHQQSNIFWKLIKLNGRLKLSLTVSVLDPEIGLVGIIQMLFSHEIFDQQIDQATGPDSLVFLIEVEQPHLLIATTEYEAEAQSIGQAFTMVEGEALPEKLQQLLASIDEWVYQSPEYFLLSVPISDVFRLVYLTDVDSFSFYTSDRLWLGVLIVTFLSVLGFLVERLVNKQLTRIKIQDEELAKNNHLLTKTLSELEETQQELIQKEKIASLGDVVAGLAHQINTPLSIAVTAVSYINESILKVTEKVDTGLKKSEFKAMLAKGYESSQLIGNNLAKATILVDNFKLLASNDVENEIIQFDVVEYTQAVLSGLKLFLEKRRIKAKITGEKSVKICNYSMCYTQIIVQLVNNAVIHGIEHDGHININIRYDEQGSGVCVDLIDDGKGISGENISRIFEPFFTSKCASEQVGLGLTIVHNLVLGKMSGDIKVKSELGQGCVVSIFLPSLA